MKQGPILIVDDDHVVQELITLALGDAYDVKHATTGGEALTILHREPIAVVVLDYRLPDCSGLDVLEKLRSAQLCVPVIMITGYGSECVCTSAFKLGITDYFAKPMNVLDLAHSVRLALPPSSEESRGPADAAADAYQPSTLPGSSSLRADMPIQKAVLLIQHRYWDNLSLGRVAREVGMSRHRLSHRFTQVIGVSFRQYLLRVRLERAKTLLSAGNASITEVALAVGFSDLPRFDKLFRRHTGITPSAYRSQSPPA